MKKKVLKITGIVGLIGGICCLVIVIYFKYQMKAIQRENTVNNLKFEKIILNSAEKKLKTNDLIFLCELKRSLGSVNVDFQDIYEQGIHNNTNLDNFMTVIKEDIAKDKELQKFSGDNDLSRNAKIVSYLCTIHDYETQISKSVYTKFLAKKYGLDTDFNSIAFVDVNELTEEDYAEFKKAKLVEKMFRSKF